MYTNIPCQQCGSTMEKTHKVDKSLGLQLVGALLFIFGIILVLTFSIASILGLILIIVAARLGYKKVKVWKCSRCGYFFERAE